MFISFLSYDLLRVLRVIRITKHVEESMLDVLVARDQRVEIHEVRIEVLMAHEGSDQRIRVYCAFRVIDLDLFQVKLLENGAHDEVQSVANLISVFVEIVESDVFLSCLFEVGLFLLRV